MTTYEHTPTQTPKLSALMRAGAKLHPQVKENYFSTDAQGEVIGTCALGAPYEAYRRMKGQACVYPWYSEIEHFLSELGLTPNRIVTDPTNLKRTHLHDTITYLNDHRGWTREAIADWLETQGL